MLWVAHGAERNPSLLPIYLSYEIRFVTSLLDFRKSFRYSRGLSCEVLHMVGEKVR